MLKGAEDMARKSVSTIDVEIAGREYRLTTDENSEYVHQLAEYVTARIFQIKRESGASPLDCATLAAFMLADELNKLNTKYEKLAQKG